MKQVGLVGYPVTHSLSPSMQQAAFDALGVESCYALWETQPDSLTERIASLRSPSQYPIRKMLYRWLMNVTRWLFA